MFNVTISRIITKEKAAKTSILALFLGAVLNWELETLFIYVFNFEISGAAIATAISQAASAIVYLFYIFSKKSNFTFKVRDYVLSKEIFSEIFKISIPVFVFNCSQAFR